MNFSKALEDLKAGHSISREGWNGKGMYLGLQIPDADSKNSLPYIYLINVNGDRIPWVASHSDMLADDWVVVGE